MALLGRWQHIEYVIGLNLDRRMFDVLRCMPTVPGAIGAFRRETLDAVGGVSGDTLAEDTDLTMAASRAGWRVVYAPDARAWTEAPAALGQLWRQRYRWCYGTMQAMWKHRGAVLERGTSGQARTPRAAVPAGLPGAAAAARAAHRRRGPLLRHLPASAEIASSGWPSWAAVRQRGLRVPAGRASLKPLWSLPLQQFVYRQLMFFVVMQSVASAVYGIRLRWHVIRRTGEWMLSRTAPPSSWAPR